MPIIEAVSSITAKGQTTVPKAIRQALGVGFGGRIAFRIDGDTITIRAAEDDERDPALLPFLTLLEADLADRAREIRPLSPALTSRIDDLIEGPGEFDPDMPIEGDVAL